MLIKAFYAIFLSDVGLYTPPSRPGLDICGWPNNNHRIDFDTILELSGPNLTPKANSWEEGCPSA